MLIKLPSDQDNYLNKLDATYEVFRTQLLSVAEIANNWHIVGPTVVRRKRDWYGDKFYVCVLLINKTDTEQVIDLTIPLVSFCDGWCSVLCHIQPQMPVTEVLACDGSVIMSSIKSKTKLAAFAKTDSVSMEPSQSYTPFQCNTLLTYLENYLKRYTVAYTLYIKAYKKKIKTMQDMVSEWKQLVTVYNDGKNTDFMSVPLTKTVKLSLGYTSNGIDCRLSGSPVAVTKAAHAMLVATNLLKFKPDLLKLEQLTPVMTEHPADAFASIAENG